MNRQMVSGRDKDCKELRAKRGPQGRPDPTPDLAGAPVGMSGPAGAAPAFSPQCIPGQPLRDGDSESLLSRVFCLPSLSHHLPEAERPLLTLPLPSVEHVASSLGLSSHVFKMGIMTGGCREESVLCTVRWVVSAL